MVIIIELFIFLLQNFVEAIDGTQISASIPIHISTSISVDQQISYFGKRLSQL